MLSTSEPDLEFNHESEIQSEVQIFYKDEEIANVAGNLLGSSNGLDRSRALHKYMKIGEKLYKESHQMDEKIRGFESCIRRSYFHMKPLDDNQVENWHKYLDFVEKQEDFDWVVKLYERCLIPAANYPEFWMRYVHFMETKGGRELANSALDRAVGIFLKSENIMLPDKHKIEKEQNAQLRNQLAQLAQLEQAQKLQIQQQDSTIQSLQNICHNYLRQPLQSTTIRPCFAIVA
ncbi:hypothetical protein EUGRSUZ_C00013 [Eucalyptus grandis]|uniref:Suppressor of forked domain-containing protein n=2 Tax=Eucalyptus grandis TaxID=71139 RepID=A0A059CJI6_EUCGR|nr:hypothetical protein EUGRSUZ_C00013 [Eucalyptus grandis]